MATLIAGNNQMATTPITAPPGYSLSLKVRLTTDSAGAQSPPAAQSAVVPLPGNGLSTGGLQQIAVILMMPAAGTYYSFVDVFVNGILYGTWTQPSVTVQTLVTSGNFVYSEESFTTRPFSELYYEYPTTMVYIVYRCTIKNQSSLIGKRTINLTWESWFYGAPYMSGIAKTFELTLNPNESYHFVYDPRISSIIPITQMNLAQAVDLLRLQPQPSQQKEYYIYLLDSAGGKSLVHRVA